MNRIIQVCIISWFVSGIISCKHDAPKNPANNPVAVNISKVGQQHIVYYDAYPATTIALKEVELRCEVGGKITGIFFTEGKPVRKGEKLYEIDRSRYQASYQQAMANVDIAQSNLERTQRDADRYIELSKQDAIAKQRLDNALTDLQNAKLQVVSAKADLVKAENDLDYSLILAPFDGTIGISNVRMGSLVIPNQTLLNVVSSDDPLGVDFVINQRDVGRFQQLTKRKITKSDSIFRLLLADNTVYPVQGDINLIDRAVDPQSGTIKVRLTFPNPDRVLKPGMNCNAQVLNENSGSQLIVPNKAIVEQMGEFFIYTLQKGNIAKQVKIMPGPRIGPNVIIKEGVQPGEQIVVDGVQKIHDGSPLQTGGASPAAGKGTATAR
jgi:membrane fusion protein, multidrug efflux system